MSQTRITISAQDNGVLTTIDRIKQSAVNLSRQMIEDASKQTLSGREQIKIIEEQIRAIERRSKLNSQLAQFELDEKLSSGEISQKKHDRKTNALEEEAREDSIQIQLLRDIIQTLQENAREQLRTERDFVEDRIRQQTENTLQGLSPEEDLTLRLQREAGAGSQPSEKNESEDNSNKASSQLRGVVGYGQQALHNVTMAPNDVFALAAFVSMIPIVGSAISGLINKTLQEGTQLAQARGKLQGLTGDRVSNIGEEASAYGTTMADFMSQYAFQYAKAQGTYNDVDKGGLDVLTLEKAFSLNSGSILEFVKNLRQSDDGKDVNQKIGQLLQSLTDKGAIQEGDFTQLEEYLGVLNELTRNQAQTLDRIDVGINSAVIAELAKVGSGFSNPDVLRSIIATLNQNIQTPTNQYAQAMQFAILSKLNPQANRFELMQMQEQGIQDPRILQEVLRQFKETSGGNESLFFEQLKAYFPQLSFNQTARLGRSFLSGEVDFSQLSVSNFEGIEGTIATRAQRAVPSMQVRSVELDNLLAVKGEDISRQMGKLVDGLGGIDGAVGGILDTGTEILKALNALIAFFNGSSGTKVMSNVIPTPSVR